MEWVAISSSRGSSQPWGSNPCLLCLPHWQVDSSPWMPPGKPASERGQHLRWWSCQEERGRGVKAERSTHSSRKGRRPQKARSPLRRCCDLLSEFYEKSRLDSFCIFILANTAAVRPCPHASPEPRLLLLTWMGGCRSGPEALCTSLRHLPGWVGGGRLAPCCRAAGRTSVWTG